MLTYQELKEQLQIDPNKLDEVCSKHPVLYMEACELASDTKTQVEVAEFQVEQIEAEIALGYRTGVLKLPDGAKLTETYIASLVAENPKAKEAKQKLINLRNLSAKCTGMMGAYEHRRSMLTNETSLYTSQYYHGVEIKIKDPQRDSAMREIIQNRRKNE